MALLQLLLLCFPLGRAWSQSPFLRAADTRTSTPEAVMGARKEWGTDLNFGGSFTHGNTDIDYITAGFDVFRHWAKDTAYANGTLLYNAAGGKHLLNQGNMALRYDHVLQGPWKVFAFNTHAYNEFIRLDYRTVTGAGPWYDFKSGTAEHGVSLALAHEYEEFTGGATQRSGRLSLRDISRIPLSPVAEFHVDSYYMPKPDDFQNFRFYVELALQTVFWKDFLGIKVSWIEEYDSRPQPKVKRNDTLWLTSLTARFGK